jgi:arsenate reductase-like glutaredoxin family protein
MTQKRATFMAYSNDERCSEVRKFIEDAGIILNVRDLKKNPLSEAELDVLLGHIPMVHLLNPASPTYRKKGLDKGLPEREEMLQMIAEDPTLLRQPIVKTMRLFTVGCDKKKIAEMLQITRNGGAAEEPSRNSAPRTSRHAVSSPGK